ncbi:MAG: hypothetical protein A3F10_02920 [Coxiella sp. RIFCSPHIGHO2_12_FULL_42_15]|nr:MAG: hypothetical protein A3F10_02920 [Coxiella sp. RIFCSPHIGHO2_12_FULL_42_15]
MKKLLVTTLLGLSLTPLFCLANALDDLVRPNASAGVCGYPPASNPTFCRCFVGEAVASCKAHGTRHGVTPLMCTDQRILINVRAVTNASAFCAQFLDMMPSGVTPQECAEDITYVKSHC